MKLRRWKARKWKAGAAALLAAGMAVTGLYPGGYTLRVEAEQAQGTAPYINTWLVSGPYEEPVADEIYGTEEGLPLERPADGNWAKLATMSATSCWQPDAYDYPSTPPTAESLKVLVDGNKSTMWLSQMHDTNGDPSTWPVWDPKPTLTMEWAAAIKVKEVYFYNRHDTSWGDQDISRIDEMHVVLKGKDGTVLAEQTVTEIDYTGTNPGVASFDEAVEGVKSIDLEIIHNGEKTLHNVGLGLSEVAVYDGDEIQEPDRPEDGNWARWATASANSEFSGAYTANNAIDGNTGTDWASRGDDGIWPKTLTLEWEMPVQVKRIEVLGRPADPGVDDVTAVQCELYDEAGELLRTVETTDPTNAAAGFIEMEHAVEGVHKIVMTLEGERSGNLGCSEVYVYDGGTDEFDVNLAPTAAVTASSAYPNNPVEYLVDGTTSHQWVSLDNGQDTEPWVMLTWDTPVTFNEVSLAQWGDGRHVNQYYDLTFTFADGETMGPVRVDSTDSSPSKPTVYSYDGYLTDVTSVKVEVDKGISPYPSITGISEMEVYKRQLPSTELPPEGPDPEIQITPRLGEPLNGDADNQVWEYFDDRLWNRTYDDYQDLNGYYSVKKGVDTKNKFVYAHTYVYSPKRQWAQLRIGSTGSYRIYLNDELMNNSTVPAEVHKDMTVLNVVLKEGWNKVLLQIEHTYTEDCNANGVPVAQDYNVSYLGFYGRVTDRNGNQLEGLSYSVNGPTEETLQITTGGLYAEDVTEDGMGLPDNNMPTGYKEWPYVWNKSTTGNSYGLSASAFQFQAAGGAPGYTWKIVGGSLPDNLELNQDGTIADGLVNGKPDLNSDKGIIPAACEEGDYTFTVRVTDQNGQWAEKEFTITVKERPNKWFEEGRVGALSHCIPIAEWSIDPNFSFDQWAERAKRQGHSLVSIESVQQHYYWPSKFDDPENNRNKYYIDEETGTVKDGLKEAAESVKRYGMRFGLYYATQITDVTVQDIADLIKRYDPDYLYFDGPQFYGGTNNFDVIYSNIRNYSNDIIVNANAWGEEYGDPDLGTSEASGIYANLGASTFVKKVVFEPWKSVHSKNNYTPYYARRDDYRLVAQEMIMNAGRGYVDNNDQMPLMSRGVNWDSPEDVATRYPISVQEFIDIREGVADWFAPEGKPERHESTTGTTPYYLSGYGYEDDGKGNYEEFAHPSATVGPRWGYAVSRDNNIYLHIMSGPDSKIGFDAIENNTLEIGPIADQVESVTWLNEDEPVAGFTQEGDRLTIDLTGVEEDQVDTIIKIVTDSEERRYQLANLYLEGEQLAGDRLQILAEGQLGYRVNADDEEPTAFPALKAELSDVSFASSDTGVALVDQDGIVTPVANGTTTIRVTASYENVTKEASIKVTVKDGAVYVGEEMLSAVLNVNDREMYGELSSYDTADLNIEGRAATGGAIGLDTAEITWHTGTVDLQGGDAYDPVKITENEVMKVEDGKLVPSPVETKTRAVVWADVELDGKTFTTNRVYLDLLPYENMTAKAEITASVNEDLADHLKDGEKIQGTEFDTSKWTAPAGKESYVTFSFSQAQEVKSIDINWNSLKQNYYNTPVTFEIQTSQDGETWTTVSTQNGPTGGAYFGYYDTYEVAADTQYLRLYFPGSSNGSAIDMLEVAVNGIYAAPEYEVTISDVENGSIAADRTTACEGDEITLTVTPKTGYRVKAGSLLINNGAVEATDHGDGTYTFLMPEGEVNITAEFEKIPTEPTDPEDPDDEENPGGPEDPGDEENPGGSEDPGEEENPGGSEDPGDEEEPGTSNLADKSELKKIIEQADSLKLDGYTAETVETLKQALVKAKELMAREDLSPEDQAEVDAAVKELKAAIDGLKPAAAGDGKDDGTTVNQPGKTGDSAPVAIWLGAALLALFAGAAVTLKMKRKA